MPGQDSSLYDDAPAPAADADGGGDEGGQKSDQDDSKTSILPKSFFGGDVKPGQTCTVRVTQCHETDCQVEYVSTDSDGEGEEDHAPGEEPEPAAAPSEMSSMMECLCYGRHRCRNPDLPGANWSEHNTFSASVADDAGVAAVDCPEWESYGRHQSSSPVKLSQLL